MPFWADGRKRHAALVQALVNRRKAQVNTKHPVLPQYTKLLKGFAKLRTQDRVVEIMSDGLAHGEPLWHGLLATARELRIFSENEQHDYSDDVRKRRVGLQTELNLSTHLAMGGLFAEPTLLCVGQDPKGGTQCSALCANRWIPLLECEDLPLRASPQNKAPTNLSELRDNLAFLHEHVLWPALVGDKKPKQKYFSFVLLQSCAWHVTGVWAMHGLTPHFSPHNADGVFELRQATRVIFPPIFCLNDVSSASLAHDRAHYHRLSDTEVFRRATGRSVTDGDPATNIQLFEERDRAIYFSTDPYDEPSRRYGSIFAQACCFLRDHDRIPRSHLTGAHYRLFQAMELLFICCHRSAPPPRYLARLLAISHPKGSAPPTFESHRFIPIQDELEGLAVHSAMRHAIELSRKPGSSPLLSEVPCEFVRAIRKEAERIRPRPGSSLREKRRATAGLLWCTLAKRLAQPTARMRNAAPWLLNGMLTLFYSLTYDRKRHLTAEQAPQVLTAHWPRVLAHYGMDEERYRNLVALLCLSHP